MGFPLASRAVTVTVEVPPAVIGDVAVTVDCAPDTVPAFTTTVAVCVMATALMVADTVFVSAAVELRGPGAPPPPAVVAPGWGGGLPAPGLGGGPGGVPVMADVPPPAAIGDVAVTVDCVPDTVPGFTTTVAVCVMATALIVADTVFAWATVELRVPVATPLAVVVALGCVSVLPVPVAASTTVAPAIGLPKASRAVTVIVDWLVPLEAVMGDVATRLDCPPETALATTWTVAVWVIATALMVAETVLDSATTEVSVPVASPLAFVTLPGWVRVFPVPVAASTTIPPGIGLPNPSLAVTVIVALPVPAEIGAVAAALHSSPAPPLSVPSTVAVWVIATALIVAETVFDSATVELSVPVATPLAFVMALGWVRVLPVPVVARTTVALGIGLPNPSFAVTVIVEALPPAPIGGVA